MFLGLFSRKNINQGVEEWKNTEGAILLDVRTEEEYNEYHIPGSVNLPLDDLEAIHEMVPNLDTPLFVHCLSGARSAAAVSVLKREGYRQVTDLGGIRSYRGETVS